MPHIKDPSSLSPEQALARLIDGNRRFRASTGTSSARSWSQQQASEAQRPFAIILGCSDSRTPVEILFDEGFGDLFVVRIAGNIVAPSVVGSIEFAAAQFGSRLVVVMGGIPQSASPFSSQVGRNCGGAWPMRGHGRRIQAGQALTPVPGRVQ